MLMRGWGSGKDWAINQSGGWWHRKLRFVCLRGSKRFRGFYHLCREGGGGAVFIYHYDCNSNQVDDYLCFTNSTSVVNAHGLCIVNN